MNTVETKKTKMVAKQTRCNKDWLENPDVMKSPKFFQVTMLRNEDGNFSILGNGAQYVKRINQYKNEMVPVDVRDFARVLNRSKIQAN